MKSTVSRAVRLGELIPLYICRCLLQPQTLLSSFSQHFFPETVTTVQLQHNLPGGAGGGGVLPYKRRLWGCAAEWGRIFTTGLTITGSHFGYFRKPQNTVTRIGSHFFGFLG